ncbi:MAG: ribonuclease E/G [Defluviitaleaceae bacterium]|nr:ribonuclease E/G [Defluviitaleaceae bacterium]
MKRLLIDYQPEVVRIAYLLDKKLLEIFIDYKDKGSLVGHIINGVVKNILPSRFAFIDIGQEKNAFMNLDANNTLKPGRHVTVQVKKDATGDKGANVSSVLHFNGRYAIVSPGVSEEIGISKKIEDKFERKRLQKLAAKYLPAGYSVIMRTQSKDVQEEILKQEFEYLVDKCISVLETAKYSTGPTILYNDNPLFNDLITDDLEEIILSNEAALSYIKSDRVKLWDEEIELFTAFDIERQITKALHRNIWLPCGGFVTFDPVEACVVVDVNTGKFMGKKNYRETVLKTNLEAAECIAEQITLRNLSGMIIVDFIDMREEEDKNKLLTVFGQALKKSRIPADIVGMTSLGLVQLTRRKQREPLYRLLQQPCSHCKGTGWF